MPLTIVRQDITKMKVDIVVNAANVNLKMGGGVCGAIFKAAGAEKLQKACNKLAPIKTGEAVITSGFSLSAKYIIHAAGPVYSHQYRDQCALLLRSAYISSLKLAVENNCCSIAFPLISSGIYGYPKYAALQVATAAISDFLCEYDMEVYLVVFDKDTFVISEKLVGEVESYIDEHYVDTHNIARRGILRSDFDYRAELIKESEAVSLSELSMLCDEDKDAELDALSAASIKSVDEIVSDLEESFSATLFQLIDSKGKTDVEVYKKANIDRKLFSKIRSIKGYTPKKPTIFALAVALELNIEETEDLLERAGYAISHASKFDVIVEYFIVNGRYNIYDINQVLFKYDQPLLGA